MCPLQRAFDVHARFQLSREVSARQFGGWLPAATQRRRPRLARADRSGVHRVEWCACAALHFRRQLHAVHGRSEHVRKRRSAGLGLRLRAARFPVGQLHGQPGAVVRHQRDRWFGPGRDLPGDPGRSRPVRDDLRSDLRERLRASPGVPRDTRHARGLRGHEDRRIGALREFRRGHDRALVHRSGPDGAGGPHRRGSADRRPAGRRTEPERHTGRRRRILRLAGPGAGRCRAERHAEARTDGQAVGCTDLRQGRLRLLLVGGRTIGAGRRDGSRRTSNN